MDALLITALCGLVSFIIYRFLVRPKTAVSLPAKMKRLVVLECAKDPMQLQDYKVCVEEVDLPKPKHGEVLIRLAAATINPSDQGDLYQAAKGLPKGIVFPKVFGREGCGLVMASGGGMMAGRAVGKKVGVASMQGGTWQEYVCKSAMPGTISVLDQDLPVENAASFFVNPMTAVGFFDVVKRKGERVFIHTVGNSQLGQMVIKLSKSQGIKVVNMVRREEAKEQLEKMGADYVVVTNPGWEQEMSKLIQQLGITIAFDAIAGDMTGTMMSLLPAHSTTYVYGGLSKKPVGNLPPVDMIYHSKKVEAFFLMAWLTEGGPIKTFLRLRSSFALVKTELRPGGWAETKYEDCSLEGMWTKMLNPTPDRKLRIRYDQ